MRVQRAKGFILLDVLFALVLFGLVVLLGAYFDQCISIYVWASRACRTAIVQQYSHQASGVRTTPVALTIASFDAVGSEIATRHKQGELVHSNAVVPGCYLYREYSDA